MFIYIVFQLTYNNNKFIIIKIIIVYKLYLFKDLLWLHLFGVAGVVMMTSVLLG